MKKILTFALFAFASASYADNCARPQNTFDSVYCMKKVFFSLDEDLNKAYKALKTELDEVGTKKLKKTQLAWIKRRNTQCVIESQNAVIVPCAVEMTRERLHFLQDRLHECTSVGCINDRIQ